LGIDIIPYRARYIIYKESFKNSSFLDNETEQFIRTNNLYTLTYKDLAKYEVVFL
jgi:hypothetical protein